MPDTWYSYECPNGCATPTGVVLDVRVPWSPDGGTVPEVSCPICHHPMRFRGSWAATEGGFGARGDHPDLVQGAADEWLERMASRWEGAFSKGSVDFGALTDMPPLPGRVSIGAFIDEVRLRKAGAPLSSVLRDFLASAEHLDHCGYRDGFYDESTRCDCGLVVSRRLLARKP